MSICVHVHVCTGVCTREPLKGGLGIPPFPRLLYETLHVHCMYRLYIHVVCGLLRLVE